MTGHPTPLGCPCGGFAGATTYRDCCGPFVEDGVAVPTAEQLMRSRYTAFARGDATHLWRTWHPATRPAEVGALDGVTWTGLTVLATRGGGAGEVEGTVDFEAQFTADGKAGLIREHSHFTRRAGRWFYVDGDELS